MAPRVRGINQTSDKGYSYENIKHLRLAVSALSRKERGVCCNALSLSLVLKHDAFEVIAFIVAAQSGAVGRELES